MSNLFVVGLISMCLYTLVYMYMDEAAFEEDLRDIVTKAHAGQIEEFTASISRDDFGFPNAFKIVEMADKTISHLETHDRCVKDPVVLMRLMATSLQMNEWIIVEREGSSLWPLKFQYPVRAKDRQSTSKYPHYTFHFKNDASGSRFQLFGFGLYLPSNPELVSNALEAHSQYIYSLCKEHTTLIKEDQT